MMTERRQALTELACVVYDGGYGEIPCEAGPHPTMDRAGRVDYGRPVSRVTWQRALPPAPLSEHVTLLPCRRQSAHLHG